MDFLESKRPSPEDVMAFIKPAAIGGQHGTTKGDSESGMASLNRALSPASA
jgi:hypothetical protein